MSIDVIILAGGQGTRLGHLTKNTPKPILPINGRPFLYYLFDYLHTQGNIARIILSLGFQANKVKQCVEQYEASLPIVFVEEDSPLGTGGAIAQASRLATTEQIIVLNGDSYFPIDLSYFIATHQHRKAHLSIAVKPMQHASRYGVVHFTSIGQITAFGEKIPSQSAHINAGVYCLEKIFYNHLPKGYYSFEHGTLASIQNIHAYAIPFTERFIDIGIPEDLVKAAHLAEFSIHASE